MNATPRNDDSRDETIAVLRRAREIAVERDECSPAAAMNSSREQFAPALRAFDATVGMSSPTWFWGSEEETTGWPLRTKSEVLAAFDATIARLDGANG